MTLSQRNAQVSSFHQDNTKKDTTTKRGGDGFAPASPLGIRDTAGELSATADK